MGWPGDTLRRRSTGAVAGVVAALGLAAWRDRKGRRSDRSARAEAEQMADLAARLSAATTHADVVAAADDFARTRHGTVVTALWLADGDRRGHWRTWHATTAGAVEAGVDARAPIAAQAVDGDVRLLGDAAAVERELPGLATAGASSGVRAAVVFLAFDRALGERGVEDLAAVMAFGWQVSPRLTDALVARLATVARLCAETTRRIDLTTASARDATRAAERVRRRLALAEALTAATTRSEFTAVLERAGPLLGVDAVRAAVVPCDRRDGTTTRPRWTGSLGGHDDPDVVAVRIPLDEGNGRERIVVELAWSTPQSRLDAEDAVATLVAVARPALLRIDVLAELEAKQRSSELRAAFGARLATAVTAERTAEVIADYARAIFTADGVIVTRSDDDGEVLVVSAGSGLGTRHLLDRGAVTTDEGGPSYDAIRRRELVVLRDRTAIRDHYPARPDLLDDPAVGAMAAFPLVAGDRPIGAVRLHYRQGRLDLARLRENAARFAEQAAQALERAHLADRQRAALEQANLLREAVAALARAAGERAVADAVLERGVAALGCCSARLLVCDDDVTDQVRDLSLATDASEPQPVTRDDAVGIAVLDRRPIYGRRRRAASADEATAVLPLMAGTQCLGVLSLRWDEALAFSGAERYLLESYAEYVAQALQRARVAAREHEVVTALQERLLPQVVPSVNGAQIAARYRPAARGLEIGGDWYDVIPLTPTRTAFVVGDVVGKGPAAAASMGQLKTVVRAKAPDAPPAALLGTVDQVVEHHLEAEFMATVGYCVFDVLDRSIVYSSAGHCPALVVDADGRREWLTANGPPIGTRWTQPRRETRVEVRVPTRLVLFTDGLVERRSESLEEGLERLAAAVTETRDVPVEIAADAVLATLAPHGSQSDDIALLVADLEPAAPPLELELPADVTTVGQARHTLRDWLRSSFVDDDTASEVLIAANEAIANAVEHGSRDHEAMVRIRAARVDGALHVDVVDAGTNTVPTPDPDRGRGLEIMRALMDEVRVATSLVGTTVHMTRALP